LTFYYFKKYKRRSDVEKSHLKKGRSGKWSSGSGRRSRAERQQIDALFVQVPQWKTFFSFFFFFVFLLLFAFEKKKLLFINSLFVPSLLFVSFFWSISSSTCIWLLKLWTLKRPKLVVGCWLLPRDGNGNGMTAAIGNQLCVKRRVASEREREYNFESRRWFKFERWARGQKTRTRRLRY